MYFGQSPFANTPTPKTQVATQATANSGAAKATTVKPNRPHPMSEQVPAHFKVDRKRSHPSPLLRLEQRKRELENTYQIREALREEISQLRHKVQTGALYVRALDVFGKLDSGSQDKIRALVAENQPIIDRLGVYYKLKSSTDLIKKSTGVLDAELDFWGNLAKLKKGGENIGEGSRSIKRITPDMDVMAWRNITRGDKAPRLVGDQGLKAAFAKEHPTYKLGPKGRAEKRINTGAGFGFAEDVEQRPPTQEELEAEEVVIEKAKQEAYNKEAFEKYKNEKFLEITAKEYRVPPKRIYDFIKTLPGKNAWREKLIKEQRPSVIREETQRVIRELPQVDREVKDLRKLMGGISENYKKVVALVKTKMAPLLAQREDNQKITTAVAILVNLRPERFKSTELDLAQAIKNSLTKDDISTLKGLGESDQDSALREADNLLAKQTALSKEIMGETALKGAALETLKRTVKGGPLPTAIEPAIEEAAQQSSLEAPGGNTVVALITLVVGAYLISKVIRSK